MTELGHRLNQIELPDSERAMRVAARVIATEVARAKPSWLRRWRRWITSVFVGALIGFAFTQPGRAITGELGELVGIGEVGGPPTQSSQVGGFTPSSGEVVLAAGNTVDGVPFGIVAYRSDERIAHNRAQTVCVNTEFVGARNEPSGQCHAGRLRYGAICCTLVAIGDLLSPTPYAEGQISPRVARVRITYVDVAGLERSVDATVGMITEDLAADLDIRHPSGLFFANLPALATVDRPGPRPIIPAAPVVFQTFDAAGDQLESETGGPRRDQTARRR